MARKTGKIATNFDKFDKFMHDFAFMRPNKTGVIPKASDYGTFAPNEARLAPYSDLRRSDYNPGHTQSFFFGFNVLYSRLGEQMDLALRRSGALTRVNRRNVIDGDIVAKALRGKHVEAGMTKKDFDTLLSMLNNNYTSRPTVENFISSFKAAITYEHKIYSCQNIVTCFWKHL